MKRVSLTRFWDAALAKVQVENNCRYCMHNALAGWPRLEAAHTYGRGIQDKVSRGPRGGRHIIVNPDSVVPLCSPCHLAYDGREISLVGKLTFPEMRNIIEVVGKGRARRRLSGERMRHGHS